MHVMSSVEQFWMMERLHSGAVGLQYIYCFQCLYSTSMLWIKLNLPSVNMFEYVPAPVETFPTETAVFIVLITIFKHSISLLYATVWGSHGNFS
jgi:hypothetical protein